MVKICIAGSDMRTRSRVKASLLDLSHKLLDSEGNQGTLLFDDVAGPVGVAGPADSSHTVLILCLDQKILASRPPRRGDRRCLTTCGLVCVCQPAKYFESAAKAAEQAKEQWRHTLMKRIPVIALLCRGYSVSKGCDWWPSFMEEFRNQLLDSRVFDAQDVHVDPLDLFLEESHDVRELYRAATRGGARSLYSESTDAQIIRKRLKTLNTALTDLRAAKIVVKGLKGARRNLQKKSPVIRLSFNVETCVLITAVDSYLLAIPALVHQSGEGGQKGQGFSSKEKEDLCASESAQIQELKAGHKWFAITVESFRAAADGARSREDEELLKWEEEIQVELSARETEVQLKYKEVFHQLIAEIFGHSSPVHNILGISHTTQIMAKLQRVKEQVPWSKILQQDIQLFVDFMYEENRGSFERKAADLQRKWHCTVLPDLAEHLKTLIRERHDPHDESSRLP